MFVSKNKTTQHNTTQHKTESAKQLKHRIIKKNTSNLTKQIVYLESAIFMNSPHQSRPPTPSIALPGHNLHSHLHAGEEERARGYEGEQH